MSADKVSSLIKFSRCTSSYFTSGLRPRYNRRKRNTMASSISRSHVLVLCACICICSSFTAICAEKDLPEGSPKCKRNDPKLSECLLKASETMKPQLIKGMPSLGMPAIEPLIIPEIRLEQGTQALNFKAVAKDVKVTGLSNYKFNQMNLDFEAKTFTAKGYIESLELEGDVKINGKILVAPIAGEGNFKAQVDKADIDINQKFEIIQKKGKDYMHPISSDVKIDTSKPVIQFNGLFGEDEQLGKATNKLISDNADALFEDLKPALEKVINELVDKLIFKTIEEKVPFDTLFPKD